MSAPNSKDFFSSFLESAEGAQAKDTPGSPGDSADVEKVILNFLISRDGPVSVKEMLAALSIPPSLAMGALGRLSEARLVEYRQIENDDVVELSDLGRRVSA
jgi:hypothetical protein